MTNHTSRLLHLVPSLFALSTTVAKAEPVAAAPAAASQEMATETTEPHLGNVVLPVGLLAIAGFMLADATTVAPLLQRLPADAQPRS